ncbi:MAG: hypothetical protein II748_02050 [Clostridia bacterium]|nr:hypothetical protein [Clostridia bacterium]
MFDDERAKEDGIRFMVGKWQADFVIEVFSADRAENPVEEFITEEGRSFEGLEFEFFEDHTMDIKTPEGKGAHGTWEQTDYMEFSYDLDLCTEDYLANANRTMIMWRDGLMFETGFLGIGLVKVSDGRITEEQKIEDVLPEAQDSDYDEIIGRYFVEKVMSFANDSFDLFTKEEYLGSGENDREVLNMFDMVYDICGDHMMKVWMKIPEGFSDDMIQDALDSKQLLEVDGGYGMTEEKEWKKVGGKYYYSETAMDENGDESISWEELTVEDDGKINLGEMFILSKE